MLGWERIKYKGSFEWIINVIAGLITKVKRYTDYKPGIEKTKPERAWYDPPRMDPKDYFYDVDWINIYNKDELDPKAEKNLILGLLIAGIILFAINLIAIYELFKQKDKVKTLLPLMNTLAVVGLLIHIGFWVFVSITPFSSLGISL